MFEVRLHERTTWRVIEEFVDSSKELYGLLLSKPEPRRLRHWWRARKKRKLDDRVTRLDADLARRYKGLLVQIFERSGVKAEDYEEKVGTIYEMLRDRVLQMRDHRDFPEGFWNVCAAATAATRIAPLAPKFMIRPFVDEIPSPLERDAFRAYAYRDDTVRRPTEDEFEALIDNACNLLHHVMQGNDDIGILTGGVLTPEQLDAISSPLEQYTEWLFRA